MHYSDASIFPSHTTLICMYIPYSLSFITSHIHLLLHFLRSYPYSYVMHIPYALSNNTSYFLTVMYIHISHSFLLYAISIYSLEWYIFVFHIYLLAYPFIPCIFQFSHIFILNCTYHMHCKTSLSTLFVYHFPLSFAFHIS